MSTEETIEAIRKADSRLKKARIIFYVVVFLAVATLLGFGVKQFESTQTLLDNQNKTLTRLTNAAHDRTNQINDLQKHIDCIVALFGTPNRTNFFISEIQNCKISNIQTGETTTNQ